MGKPGARVKWQLQRERGATSATRRAAEAHFRHAGGSWLQSARALLHTRRMVPTTLRHTEAERPPAATYWRRRFVALVIGLSVLALVAWALSGAMGGSAPAANTAATRPVHGTL